MTKAENIEPVHIMLDLETMSTASNAVILAIGAVHFGQAEPDERASFYIDIEAGWYMKTLVGKTFDVDLDTVMWWLQQSDAARAAVANNQSTAQLPGALDAFQSWAITRADGDPSRLHIWGNGAGFDNVILANAYKACGVDAPWRFRNDRCYRTLKNEHADIPATPMAEEDRHHALKDAVHQANHLMQIAAAKNISLSTL